MFIQAGVAETLVHDSVIDGLVVVLKYHEGYKQNLTVCMAIVAERITAEYAIKVQSEIISALRNESITDDIAPVRQ